jgi:hypothetical protein
MQNSPLHPRNWRSIGGTALAVVVTAAAWYRWHGQWRLGAFLLAASLFGLALARPRTLAPIQALLDRLSHGLAAVVTWLLLGAVFAVCFIPGRLVLVVLRRDPMRRSRDPARVSYWEPLQCPRDPERFRRQF